MKRLVYLLHNLTFTKAGIKFQSSVTNRPSNFAYAKYIHRPLSANFESHSACGPWVATNNKTVYNKFNEV
jgi:hypothetical protein